MNYLEQSLGDFLDSVAGGEPTPGGGAVAAVAVALAAGLSAMAAHLSAGHLDDTAGLAEQAERLRLSVAPLAQEDANAYVRFLTAYRSLDKDDPENRRECVRTRLFDTINVPLAIAETGAEVAEVAALLAREGNPRLKGDAITAALLANAGVRAAAELVKINATMGEISDDRSGLASELAARALLAVREAVEGS